MHCGYVHLLLALQSSLYQQHHPLHQRANAVESQCFQMPLPFSSFSSTQSVAVIQSPRGKSTEKGGKVVELVRSFNSIGWILNKEEKPKEKN